MISHGAFAHYLSACGVCAILECSGRKAAAFAMTTSERKVTILYECCLHSKSEESMSTKILSDRPGGSPLPDASSPPLEPAEMPVSADVRQQELNGSGEDLATEQQGTKGRGKLVAIAAAAILAVGALAYFLWPSGQEKTTAQSGSEQPIPATPRQSPPDTRETQTPTSPPATSTVDQSSAPAEPSDSPAARPAETSPGAPALPVQPGPPAGQARDAAPGASPQRAASPAAPPTETSPDVPAAAPSAT